MRAITVYRKEDGSNSSYPTRRPIGSVLERRTYDRGDNYNDMLRLARRLFALDTTDAARILIYVSQGRKPYLPEFSRDRAME